jgi:purine-cytosine permease-like protein
MKMIRIAVIAAVSCLFGYFAIDILEERGSVALALLALTLVWFDIMFGMLYKNLHQRKYRCR